MKKVRNKVSILMAVLTFTVIAGSTIGTSQNRTDRVEVSSRTVLKTKPENLRSSANGARKPEDTGPHNIPDDVIFRQIFKHIEQLDEKAEKKETKQQEKSKKFRGVYKKLARLDEKESITLKRIALKTNRELEILDKRAKQIIDQIRSQTPNRRIEFGQRIPLPPKELFDLANQRTVLTLEAIRELREEVGTPGFVRFREFVNKRVKPGIRKVGNGAIVRKGGEQR